MAEFAPGAARVCSETPPELRAARGATTRCSLRLEHREPRSNRSRLVPVWLALLGLVRERLLLTSAVVEVFAYGVDAPVALQLPGAAPIALQETILAVILIWKGFAAPSVAAANGEPGWRGSGGVLPLHGRVTDVPESVEGMLS